MRRWLTASFAGALLLAAVPISTAAASPSPSPGQTPSATPSSPTPTPRPSSSAAPSPSPSPASTPSPTPSPAPSGAPSPTPDPANQKLIDQARQQIGSGIADTLAAAQRLADTLTLTTSEQNQIQQQISTSQARIESLTLEIQRIDADIATTQKNIEVERSQIALMARTLYESPDSLLIRLIQAGSVRDMVTQTSDLMEAALRADSLRRKLSDDLARLNQDEARRTSDLQRQQQLSAQLTAALGQFGSLASQMQQTAADLLVAIHDGQDALSKVGQESATLAQQLASMLQAREQQLITTTEQEVWQQEQLWAALNGSLIPQPVATTDVSPAAGARFAWPIQGAVLTQGFGPSALLLEPAMFGFPHFHAGLDLASPNTTVTAAAAGVVAVVGSGVTGYGNYVIIVHADGFVTLYGHLALAIVAVGQQVAQGRQIGVEGSTGASTGVHLHFEVRLHGVPIDPTPYLPSLLGA